MVMQRLYSAITSHVCPWLVSQIKSLEESAAFTRGADFLSESFIFFVGGGVVVFEYQRGKAKDAEKAREKDARWKAFTEVCLAGDVMVVVMMMMMMMMANARVLALC